MLVIAAALSIQDPRERPVEQQQAADERTRRFADADSDFLGYLKLWDYLREQQRELSSSQFRRACSPRRPSAGSRSRIVFLAGAVTALAA